MKTNRFACLAALLASGGVAQAWEFRSRFVERVGDVDVELPSNTIDAGDRRPRHIRIQFGVFDDAAGPAPAGGYIGWLAGTLAVSGPEGNSDERRSNGRMAPFNFVPGGNGNPPPPAGFPGVPDNPWTLLTEIHNTLGTQSFLWQCNPDGTMPPQPLAVVRGLNTFVSTYAFTIDPSDGPEAESYTVTAAGNLFAASEWRTNGFPTPPDCGDPNDPSDDIPGSITYAPFPTSPQAFSNALTVIVPGPGGAALLGIAALAASRRGRGRATP